MKNDLINRLFNTLNIKSILYCHWKGNFSLSKALSGEKDIELFVSRSFLHQVINLLIGFGFKSAV